MKLKVLCKKVYTTAFSKTFTISTCGYTFFLKQIISCNGWPLQSVKNVNSHDSNIITKVKTRKLLIFKSILKCNLHIHIWHIIQSGNSKPIVYRILNLIATSIKKKKGQKKIDKKEWQKHIHVFLRKPVRTYIKYCWIWQNK